MEGVNESERDRKARYRSLYIVHTSALVFSLGFSIVLTGILPYLRRLTKMQDEALLEIFGWMVAINPLGQMIFSPLLGWLSSKIGKIRPVMIASSLIFIAGSLTYSCLSLMPSTDNGRPRWILMLAGRLLVGISSANLAPSRAYVAGATYKEERSGQLSILSLFQTIGFVLGPAIQAAVTPLGCSQEYLEGHLSLDMYTLTGWISVSVGFLSLILFLPGVFEEFSVSNTEVNLPNGTDGSKARVAPSIKDTKPDLIAVGACLFGFFVFFVNFVVLEVIGVPLCQQQLGWSESESVQTLGILMACGAVLSILCFALIGPLSKKVDERLIYLILGIFPMLLSRLAHLPMSSQLPQNKTSLIDVEESREDTCREGGGQGGCDLAWCSYTPKLTEFQFYLGYVIATLSFPFCIGLCQAMFSKSLGERPQGTWMGLLTASGSLARIMGPILVSYVYEEKGTYWLFGLCAASLLSTGCITSAAFRHLVPPQEKFLGEEATAFQLIQTPQQVETCDQEETAKMLSKSDPQEAHLL